MTWKVAALIVLASLVVSVSAYAGPDRASATTTVSVAAGKPSEFHFVLSKKSVARGTLVFKVTNRGTIVHDFRIAGKTSAHLSPGKSTTMRVVVKKAGRYSFLCTLPSHAAAGMKGVLVVK